LCEAQKEADHRRRFAAASRVIYWNGEMKKNHDNFAFACAKHKRKQITGGGSPLPAG